MAGSSAAARQRAADRWAALLRSCRATLAPQLTWRDCMSSRVAGATASSQGARRTYACARPAAPPRHCLHPGCSWSAHPGHTAAGGAGRAAIVEQLGCTREEQHTPTHASAGLTWRRLAHCERKLHDRAPIHRRAVQRPAAQRALAAVAALRRLRLRGRLCRCHLAAAAASAAAAGSSAALFAAAALLLLLLLLPFLTVPQHKLRPLAQLLLHLLCLLKQIYCWLGCQRSLQAPAEAVQAIRNGELRGQA